MKKIDISREDFDALAEQFKDTYIMCPDASIRDSIATALKTHIFKITKPFNLDSNVWNDCDVEIPTELQDVALILRRKDYNKCIHNDDMLYKVGFYNFHDQKFVDQDYNQIIDDTSNWEFKIIR